MRRKIIITPLKDEDGRIWTALWPKETAKALKDLGGRLKRSAIPALPEERMVVPLEAAARALGKSPEEVLKEAAELELDHLAARAILEAAFPAEVAAGEVRGAELVLWSPELGCLTGSLNEEVS